MKGISQYVKSVRVNEYTCIDSLEIKVKALDSNTQTCPTTEKWVKDNIYYLKASTMMHSNMKIIWLKKSVLKYIHSLAGSVNGEITFISSRLDDKDAEIESITEAYHSIKYDFNQIRIYYEKLLEYQKKLFSVLFIGEQ